MNTFEDFPSFDTSLPDLNQFILDLVKAYKSGKIKSWDALEQDVNAFFTPVMLERMEIAAPGWKKMASYSNGATLTHELCALLGLFMLPEFENLSPEHQQIIKWIVLFHDMEKEAIKGVRDLTHGFRSAALTARILPKLGFKVSTEYKELIDTWSALTSSAVVKPEGSKDPIQDNSKLPEILSGIDRMFGEDTPAALIVKGVLLHMSISVVSDWPQAAPLTEEEIDRYVNKNVSPLLKVMTLVDNEGWSIFEPKVREQQRSDTLRVFRKIEKIPS